MYFFGAGGWNKRFYKCRIECLVSTVPRILYIVTDGVVSGTALLSRTFCDDENVHVKHFSIEPL